MQINNSSFPTENSPFYWGVSTAAYQMEGGHDADGKGPSIWDTFVVKKKKALKGEHAQVSTDFYHRYADDIKLLAGMQIPNFRFSLAWSRIMPQGKGAINMKGVDFYNRVIDTCLQNGVTPWLTLYHWDLPQALEDKGGWTNRDVVGWFSDFSELCARRFSDRVSHWMVLNEPLVFTGAGYFLGYHAPGRWGLPNFLPAMHHAALAIGAGERALRSIKPDLHIGSTFSCSQVAPMNPQSERDIAAARRVDALLNRLFIEPCLGLGYPAKTLPLLNKVEKYMKPSDEHMLKAQLDFVGVQNYTREMVAFSFFVPYLQAQIIKANKRNVPYTLMNWEVYPPSIYHMLKQFAAYEQIKELIVTENGSSFEDIVVDDVVMDQERTQYLQDYIAQVWKAKQEGVPVNGYFVWTFTDNFEWAEGYSPRFGLVHIDFKTLHRRVKESGKWYSRFLQGIEGITCE